MLWRVRDRRSFLALRSDGVRRRSGPVSVTALLVPDGKPPRVAFAIGRRTGSAVERNRLRRRLLPMIEELDLPSGVYLIGAGPGAAGLDGAALRRHLSDALEQVKAVRS